MFSTDWPNDCGFMTNGKKFRPVLSGSSLWRSLPIWDISDRPIVLVTMSCVGNRKLDVRQTHLHDFSHSIVHLFFRLGHHLERLLLRSECSTRLSLTDIALLIFPCQRSKPTRSALLIFVLVQHKSQLIPQEGAVGLQDCRTYMNSTPGTLRCHLAAIHPIRSQSPMPTPACCLRLTRASAAAVSSSSSSSSKSSPSGSSSSSSRSLSLVDGRGALSPRRSLILRISKFLYGFSSHAVLFISTFQRMTMLLVVL